MGFRIFDCKITLYYFLAVFTLNLDKLLTNPLTVMGQGCIIDMNVKSAVKYKYSVKIIKF